MDCKCGSGKIINECYQNEIARNNCKIYLHEIKDSNFQILEQYIKTTMNDIYEAVGDINLSKSIISPVALVILFAETMAKIWKYYDGNITHGPTERLKLRIDIFCLGDFNKSRQEKVQMHVLKIDDYMGLRHSVIHSFCLPQNSIITLFNYSCTSQDGQKLQVEFNKTGVTQCVFSPIDLGQIFLDGAEYMLKTILQDQDKNIDKFTYGLNQIAIEFDREGAVLVKGNQIMQKL